MVREVRRATWEGLLIIVNRLNRLMYLRSGIGIYCLVVAVVARGCSIACVLVARVRITWVRIA